jgi:hypothetical protein
MKNLNMDINPIVMPMEEEEFDMILGKEWLTQVNPEINWRTNTVTINET